MDVLWTCLDLNLTHLLIFSAWHPLWATRSFLPFAVTHGVSFLTFKIGKSYQIVVSCCRQEHMILFFFHPQYHIHRLLINCPCSLSSDGFTSQDLIGTECPSCVLPAPGSSVCGSGWAGKHLGMPWSSSSNARVAGRSSSAGCPS